MSTRYGILLLGDRVAPRCVVADGLLVAVRKRRRLVSWQRSPLQVASGPDLLGVLTEHAVDVLVCGGIRRELKQVLVTSEVRVIDNVAATAEEVLQAVEAGSLHPGLGFDDRSTPRLDPAPIAAGGKPPSATLGDCLSCQSRACLLGHPCHLSTAHRKIDLTPTDRSIMDAAMDVKLPQRTSATCAASRSSSTTASR